MLLQFRTTITSDSKVVIRSSKVIAWTYVKSWRFIIDLLSCIPYDSLIITGNGGLSEKFKIIGVLKMIRIFRFTKIISFLNATENMKLSLKLLKLLFYLIIYIHLQACAWYLYTKQDRTWFPLTDII